MSLRLLFGAGLAAGLLAVTTLSAAPGFWQAATQADFLRGEVDQLSVDAIARAATEAVAIAKANARLQTEPVVLAPLPEGEAPVFTSPGF